MSGKEIIHEGIVQEVQNDHIIVQFISHPACSSCLVRNHCSLSDAEVRNLEVPASGKSYTTGEKVLITLGQSQGFRAVFLGYFLPFILLIMILIILLELTHNEVISGLISLSCLVPYYLILWMMKGRVSESFKFRVLKV
jgi:sigma-E factor negative regulatory protein RseC